MLEQLPGLWTVELSGTLETKNKRKVSRSHIRIAFIENPISSTTTYYRQAFYPIEVAASRMNNFIDSIREQQDSKRGRR